jgi:hypothetical protein
LKSGDFETGHLKSVVALESHCVTPPFALPSLRNFRALPCLSLQFPHHNGLYNLSKGKGLDVRQHDTRAKRVGQRSGVTTSFENGQIAEQPPQFQNFAEVQIGQNGKFQNRT